MAAFSNDPKADLKLQAKGIIDIRNGKVWEDSYLLNESSKEGRANFSDDPVIAKFQATARKGCLRANSTLRTRAGHLKRKRSKNKIVNKIVRFPFSILRCKGRGALSYCVIWVKVDSPFFPLKGPPLITD